ncbi:hypothetical protein [Flavobacterium sp. '19STA2R22 D10 B1']|uniref:hypothetical protein n=1 Tax=Flavobacterium aerium TaxID=3037261 RepID=UPI00278C8951|nr:hypothetical protein [Flavobacterium sp. '19STA2R22 D10 B1']
MRNSRNSNALPSDTIASTALLESLYGYTQKLYHSIGLEESEESIESMLTGWISSPLADYDAEKRMKIYLFNKDLIQLLRNAHSFYKQYKNKSTAVSYPNNSLGFVNSLTLFCSENYRYKKTALDYFTTIYHSWLISPLANDTLTRENIIYHHRETLNFLSGIYKIHKKYTLN